MDEREMKVLSRLQAQCSRREYCIADIRAKAEKALEGDAEAAERVLAALVEDGYADDFRFASAFARDKASLSGWGEVKIRYMLAAKGVDRDIINAALEEIDPTASGKKMESVLRAKYRSLAGDPACKLKLLRFALSRGYAYGQVKCLVDRIILEG